ncbi:hypothetical protein [Maricaulis sp.]|uniref:hypothetical protein n=1 Tax=Maricaulis sp. TaxID=1486257 RepID=UPI003A94B85B
MIFIRKITIRGKAVPDATIAFFKGPNVLAGGSDTGKSYLLHCLDYVFGSKAMTKRIPGAESYSQLFVEFENGAGEVLTLERHLSGGDLAVHQSSIEGITDSGEKVVPSRKGRSVAKDVTSVVFSFAGIEDAQLRKNARGEVQRLTIRTLIPTFLVDEISVIEERSPITGEPGFDQTARRRMFSYLLTGKDDTGVIAVERQDIVRARAGAQLGLISELLEPLDQRLASYDFVDEDQTIERLHSALENHIESLEEVSAERRDLLSTYEETETELRHSTSQIVAIDELLARYDLLEQRYISDLDRLDFLAEGGHFFEGLQEVNCPLCDQQMIGDALHEKGDSTPNLYRAAAAEASKILAYRKELIAATESLRQRRLENVRRKKRAVEYLANIKRRLESQTLPMLDHVTQNIDSLLLQRVELQSVSNDRTQAKNLRYLQEQIKSAAAENSNSSNDWESLPATSVRALCSEIESTLREWSWSGEGRVEFDRKEFDIVVDGQSRRSHGKGVRAILHSAFTISLLRYCQKSHKPHLGFVVIDSPLTSYKKGARGAASDGPIDAGMEAAFWRSLTKLSLDIQVIVIENKEPPPEVAACLHYEWFAGEEALPGERAGFIPKIGN